MADDEVNALQGIFCGDGEFEMLGNSAGGEWSFCICVTCQPSDQATTTLDQSADPLKISLQFFLPIGYPHVLPAISLACNSLRKHSASQLREELHEYAKSLEGQPMIMELVYWAQENGRKFTAASVQNHGMYRGKDGSKLHATVLHIDHMRSRVRYVKTLVSWALELSLIGRLLFLQHVILLVLMGTEDCVKDFLVRLRTQKVDVDSSGRSCKERMMTVLMQGSHPGPSDGKRMCDFQVCECSTSAELEAVFVQAGLRDVYKDAVMSKFTLLQTSAGKTLGKN